MAADAPRPTVVADSVPASAPVSHAALAGIAIVAGLVETALAAGVLTLDTRSAIPIALLHVVIVAALAAWTLRLRSAGVNTLWPALVTLAVAAAGPAGALSAAVAALLMARARPDEALLARWYERIATATAIDDTTRLADDVALGRTIDLKTASPASFLALIERGPVADQQVALGIVARRFDPTYLPALAAALKSPEPIIRVQAAAVATRVAPQISAIVDDAVRLAGESAEPRDVILAAVARTEACLASGLLDATKARAAREALVELASSLAATADADARGRVVELGREALSLAPSARRELERLLLSSGRYGDLRGLRRVMRVSAGRLYKVRRLSTGAATRSTAA